MKNCASSWLFTRMFILIDISVAMLSTFPLLLHMLTCRKNREQTCDYYSSNTENTEFLYLAVSCSGEDFSRTITGLLSLSPSSLPGESAETFCRCCVCFVQPCDILLNFVSSRKLGETGAMLIRESQSFVQFVCTCPSV